MRSNWKIIIGDAGKHDWFIYGLERGTTLISILVLSGETGGIGTCQVFLLMKLISFVVQLYTCIANMGEGNDDDDEEEIQEDDYIQMEDEDSDNEDKGDDKK